MGHDFSVADERVVVVGAARSGVAAAELLVRRGATRDVDRGEAGDCRTSDRLRGIGVRLELGATSAETFDRADLVVMSPGVPLELPEVARAAARGVPVIGELELALALVERTHRRDHGDEGEVDDDDARRPDAGGRRASRCSSAETSACR